MPESGGVKITVLSAPHTELYDPLAAITAHNHIAYCRKHGYNYLQCWLPADGHLDSVWGLRYLKGILSSSSIVLGIGIDTIFVNDKIKIEDVFEGNIQIAREDIGSSEHNVDVVLWRNSLSAFAFIDHLIDTVSVWKDFQWTWQSYFNYLVKEKSSVVATVNIVDSHVQNTWPLHLKMDDWIVHMFGYSLNDKILLAKEIKKLLERKKNETN